MIIIYKASFVTNDRHATMGRSLDDSRNTIYVEIAKCLDSCVRVSELKVKQFTLDWDTWLWTTCRLWVYVKPNGLIKCVIRHRFVTTANWVGFCDQGQNDRTSSFPRFHFVRQSRENIIVQLLIVECLARGLFKLRRPPFLFQSTSFWQTTTSIMEQSVHDDLPAIKSNNRRLGC